MSAPCPTPPQTGPAITRVALFLGFLKIGLMGFGGVAPVARHVLVEDRRWLTDQEYASVLGIGQILPGANVINASVMIGNRFHGAFGAVIDLAGLMAMPLLILVLLASLYQRFAALAAMQAVTAGSAAAAAGLVIGTALKMAWRLKPGRAAVFFGLAAFAAVGLWRLKLILVVLVLAPLSIAAVAWRRRP